MPATASPGAAAMQRGGRKRWRLFQDVDEACFRHGHPGRCPRGRPGRNGGGQALPLRRLRRRQHHGPAFPERRPGDADPPPDLRAADPARQEAREDPRPRHVLAGGGADALALPAAPRREVPRRVRLQRRRRRVLDQARARADLELRDLRRHRRRRRARRRPHGRRRHQDPRPDPARQVHLRVHDGQGVVREEQLDPPAEHARARGDVHRPQHQRHRPVPPDDARAGRAHRAGARGFLVGLAGQGPQRRQRDADDVPPDRLRRSTRRCRTSTA